MPPFLGVVFDYYLSPPLLVEDPKGVEADPVTIHKENVEFRTRNIEYRTDESLRSFFFYQRMATSTFM